MWRLLYNVNFTLIIFTKKDIKVTEVNKEYNAFVFAGAINWLDLFAAQLNFFDANLRPSSFLRRWSSILLCGITFKELYGHVRTRDPIFNDFAAASDKTFFIASNGFQEAVSIGLADPNWLVSGNRSRRRSVKDVVTRLTYRCKAYILDQR